VRVIPPPPDHLSSKSHGKVRRRDDVTHRIHCRRCYHVLGAKSERHDHG
jgi:hypothetical protein